MTVIQPGHFKNQKKATGEWLQNTSSEKFKKFPGKYTWQHILLDFTNKNTSLRVFSWDFSQIFQNNSGKLSRKVIVTVFFSTEAAFHKSYNKKF